MQLNRLVGEIAHPIPSISAEDSISRAARVMRDEEISMVPVVANGRLLGVFGSRELVQLVGEDADLGGPVGAHIVPGPVVRRYETGAEALRRFETFGTPMLLVLDSNDAVAGMITPAMLALPALDPVCPPMVGGMATPFGVYLTTGVVSGGVSKWALMATGSVMFCLLTMGSLIGNWVGENVHGIPASAVDVLVTGISLAAFLVGLRLIPLAGTHGAEHQVVHAIERGEDLRPEIVRRMPRVHPRCGTNFAAAGMLFMGIAGSEWGPDLEVRFLIAVVVTLSFWRLVGSALQRYVTTRRPTERQLASGIGSGKDLLEKYAKSPSVTPTIGGRIWNSGVLHVVAGSMLTYGLIWVVCYLFKLPVPV
jgi:CBS domain-containing protein